MTTKPVLFVLLTLCVLCACDQKKAIQEDDVIVREVTVVSSEETDVPPPPPPPGGFSSPKSLYEWLALNCGGRSPSEPVSNFYFGLSESNGTYIVCLSGVSQYRHDQYNIVSKKIVFEPLFPCFLLPEDFTTGRSRKQVEQRLTDQIREFIRTEKFRKSFLAKSDSITADFSGAIWKK